MPRSVAGFPYLALLLVLTACQASAPAARSDAGAAPVAPAPASAAAAPAPASAAPSAATATPPAPTSLVLSFSNLAPTDWPIWIAKDMGLFAKHGLDADVRLVESATGVPALIAGETQVAVLGGSEVLGAAVEGADLVMVGGLARTYPFRFMANADVTTVDALRGKRVGVSRTGSSSDIATRVALQRLNLVPDQDVAVMQVGSLTARIAALESGAIQGGVTEPPDTTRLARMGYHILFDLADLGLPSATDVIAVRRSYAAEQRATVQNVVDAVIEAIALERADPQGAQAVLGRWLQNDDAEGLAEAWEFYTTKLLPHAPSLAPEQFTDVRTVMAERNPAIGSYDVSRAVDNSFVDAAVARGLAGPE
ncbi:MAG TPA: ABC transporter substrate-binding protein [Chloroflexota bacterium]|jgi:NitT/TauT family transport system substrate-binding protein